MTRTSKVFVIALGVLAALVVVAPLLTGGLMGPGMMWAYGGPYGFGPWGRMPFFGSGWAWGLAVGLHGLTMLAFWGVIALGIVLLVRWLSGPGGHEDRG